MFTSPRTTLRPIVACTLTAAMRRMGIAKEQTTAHGFRATARTIMDERLEMRVDVVEHQLSHRVRDATGRAQPNQFSGSAKRNYADIRTILISSNAPLTAWLI